MIYALIGYSLATLAAVVTLAIMLSRAKDGQLAARDLYAKLDEAFDALEVDRNGLKVELDTERKKTAALTDRVGVAESQRNDAQRQMRDHVVERLKKANIADANRFIAELLESPLPDVIAVPQSVPISEQPGNELIDPLAGDKP